MQTVRREKEGRKTVSSSPGKEQQIASQQMLSIRERRNWLIHQLYVRQEYSSCLEVIEAQLRDTEGTCEYALYVKGLLKRMEGELSASLELLETAVLVSPENVANRKQLGRALHLVGRHADAIVAFQDAMSMRLTKGLGTDWELPYSVGLCYLYQKQYGKAMESFLESIGIQRHDCTYLQLGRAALLSKDVDTAIQVYEEGVVVSPSNPELLAVLGHLYLQQRQPQLAFDYLGRCLTLDPTNVRALVAASSIIQEHGDYDVALTKYRIVVHQRPDAAAVWSNIGACFWGKKNLYAAVACLRKSIFISPFDWIAQYNLGVVMMAMQRYNSATQCLNAAIQLHPLYAPTFALLGVSLAKLGDIDNAVHAFDKALSLQRDFVFYLNYSLSLLEAGREEAAKDKFRTFFAVWERLTAAQRRGQSSAIPGVVRQLQHMWGIESTSPPPQQPSDDNVDNENQNRREGSGVEDAKRGAKGPEQETGVMGVVGQRSSAPTSSPSSPHAPG